jgi:hypothetical protein
MGRIPLFIYQKKLRVFGLLTFDVFKSQPELRQIDAAPRVGVISALLIRLKLGLTNDEQEPRSTPVA